jgi:hypothetical protein
MLEEFVEELGGLGREAVDAGIEPRAFSGGAALLDEFLEKGPGFPIVPIPVNADERTTDQGPVGGNRFGKKPEGVIERPSGEAVQRLKHGFHRFGAVTSTPEGFSGHTGDQDVAAREVSQDFLEVPGVVLKQ